MKKTSNSSEKNGTLAWSEKMKKTDEIRIDNLKVFAHHGYFQEEKDRGQNFYVNAVDDIIKTPAQNPTIGLLICSNKDETEVQYAFNGITTPMGVASYDNVKRLQEQLPSVEELKARIRLLEKELEKNRG